MGDGPTLAHPQRLAFWPEICPRDAALLRRLAWFSRFPTRAEGAERVTQYGQLCAVVGSIISRVATHLKIPLLVKLDEFQTKRIRSPYGPRFAAQRCDQIVRALRSRREVGWIDR